MMLYSVALLVAGAAAAVFAAHVASAIRRARTKRRRLRRLARHRRGPSRVGAETAPVIPLPKDLVITGADEPPRPAGMTLQQAQRVKLELVRDKSADSP